jgi:translation elongation factor EF-1alpha
MMFQSKGLLTSSRVKTIPISALDGDNLIERSEKATWYEGWLNRDGVSVGGWTLIDAIDAL